MLGGSAAAARLTQISVIGWRFVRCGRGHYLSTQRTYLPLSLSCVYRRNDVWDWPADSQKALWDQPFLLLLIQHIWGAAQRSWGELKHPGEQHSQHKESDPTALMSVVSLAQICWHTTLAFSSPVPNKQIAPTGTWVYHNVSSPSEELHCVFPRVLDDWC